ncbi:protease modulator HflC [Candidatus Odyssella thessalonicensis]|uniref:protease modulator HflC n=1 Tax=Candidatus Odyssella thessalonicensis TaxID=84647 RepID=UPI000225AC21|nr:protease modulator HflC [Candidatus Odyssella thessalonicensis]
MPNRAIGFFAVLFLSLVGLSSSVFIVGQTQQAIVLQFGELRRVIQDPGLKFKIPFIQEVNVYEKRVLDFDLPATDITLGDQKRVRVDTYTRYRISDPVQFFKSVKPANEFGTARRLEALVGSTVRNVLGKADLRELLSENRSKIMHQINSEVKALTKGLGLDIIDLRIVRTELPPENRPAVFNRMNADLQRYAKQNRANGDEKAQEIRSTAEKERTTLLAEASRDAQILRGEGDAKAIATITEAMGKDPEFYGFYKSMEVYDTIIGEDTTLILSSDSDLFKYFSHPERALRNSH